MTTSNYTGDNRPSEDAIARAKQVRLLALDVDGVLTDGSLYFGADGEHHKGFSILDGLGIKWLQRSDIDVAIITGRRSQIVIQRAKELGINHVVQGREDKLSALTELLDSLNITLEQSAYMGDDLPDLSAIQACGLGIAPNNAHREIKQRANYVCTKAGGKGAVREAAEFILQTQDAYQALISQYEFAPDA